MRSPQGVGGGPNALFSNVDKKYLLGSETNKILFMKKICFKPKIKSKLSFKIKKKNNFKIVLGRNTTKKCVKLVCSLTVNMNHDLIRF